MHITAIDQGMLGADAIVAGSPAHRRRRGLRPAAAGQRRRRRLLLRRRRLEPGHLPRGLQPRRGARRPVVFVCENNQWAISTPIAAVDRACADIADRAAGYGFPGERRRRQRRAGGARGRRAGRGAGALGRGPDADRGQDLPHHAPLRGDAEDDRDPDGARRVARRATRSSRLGAHAATTPASPSADGSRSSRRGAQARGGATRSSSRWRRRSPDPAPRSTTSTRRRLDAAGRLS